MPDRRVIIVGTDDATGFKTICVDQQRCRQANSAKVVHRLATAVDVRRKVGYIVISVEPTYRGNASPINRDRDHLKVIASARELQSVQGRHFASTGCTPCCPNAQEHRSTTELCQRMPSALGILEDDIAHRDRPGVLLPKRG